MTALEPLAADGPIGPTWVARFGPLARVGSHGGVHVLRTLSGPPRFVKVHDEPARGAREATFLRAGLPVVTPPLLELVEGPPQTVLLLADVRRGAPRPSRVDVLPEAATVLGLLHAFPAARLPGIVPANAWVDRTRARFRDARLPEPLRAALGTLVLCGDAVCHLDLHPSNWIVDGGRVVGMLDWSSAGLADPELDLAALLVAGGGDPAPLPAVLDAWAATSGREPDPARVLRYLWLLLAERRLTKGPSPFEEACAAAVGDPSRPPHGGGRAPRAFPKQEVDGPWTPEIGRWREGGEPAVDAALTTLGIPGRSVATYQLHACNDVLRVDTPAGPTVWKVYGKPVWGPLFELERALAAALEGTGATVPAPVPLPDGRCVLRVGSRVSAFYPFLGDARPGPRDLARVAAAHAALHGVDPSPFPEIDRRPDDLPRTTLEASMVALHSSVRARITAVWEHVAAALAGTSLPQGLVHGSLHRDHAALLPDGRVAILDLEKVRVGPLVHDAARGAVYAGYRGNDEQADPAKIVAWLRAYHRTRPFTPAERAALVPCVLLALLRDVKALAQERVPAEHQRRHAAVVLDFFHNRHNLARALDERLVSPAA